MINKLWLVAGVAVVVAAGILAFLTVGHGTSGTPAQRLSSWVKSTQLGQDIGTLEGDWTAVREALAAHEGFVAVHTVCAATATSVQTFNDDLPSPDTAVTQLLARAYGFEYDAAEACYRASSVSTARFEEFVRDRTKGAALFDDVLRRVRSSTGKTLSTTTTTVLPGSTATSIL